MDLPLFVHIIAPLRIVVINNEIIICKATQIVTLYPDRMLELLIEIYNNTKYRDKLPDAFYEHFEEPAKYIGDKCLIGYDEDPAPRFNMCLKLEIDTNCMDSNRVLLKNFSFDREPIRGDFELKVRDFFFILANLSVEYLAQLELTFDLIEAELEQQRENEYIPEAVIRLHDFTYDYLKYIKEELREGRLKPEEVLRNGGVDTLITLKEEESVSKFIEESLERIQSRPNLSINHKLILFSFFDCLRYHEELHSADLYELHSRMEEYRTPEEKVYSRPEEKIFYPKQFLIERKKLLDNLEPRKFYSRAVKVLQKQLGKGFPEKFE